MAHLRTDEDHLPIKWTQPKVAKALGCADGVDTKKLVIRV